MLNFVYCFATSALDWMGQEPILQLMVAMLLMEHARSMDVFFLSSSLQRRKIFIYNMILNKM